MSAADEESSQPVQDPTPLEASNNIGESRNSPILELPPEVLQKILGYLSFHEVKLLTFSGDLMALRPFICRDKCGRYLVDNGDPCSWNNRELSVLRGCNEPYKKSGRVEICHPEVGMKKSG